MEPDEQPTRPKLILNIFGVPTTGRTTLAEALHQHIAGSYLLDYNTTAKQISHFNPKKDDELAAQLAYNTLAAVAQTGIPIIARLPLPANAQAYLRIEHISIVNNYHVINLELAAPLQTLLTRYKARLAMYRQTDKNLAHHVSLAEFQKLVQTPYYKPANTRTYNTAALSQTAIYEAVMMLVEPSEKHD